VGGGGGGVRGVTYWLRFCNLNVSRVAHSRSLLGRGRGTLRQERGERNLPSCCLKALDQLLDLPYLNGTLSSRILLLRADWGVDKPALIGVVVRCNGGGQETVSVRRRRWWTGVNDWPALAGELCHGRDEHRLFDKDWMITMWMAIRSGAGNYRDQTNKRYTHLLVTFIAHYCAKVPLARSIN
jgi:hypothetical protein